MKETYKVGVPEHIMFGDPLYFERKGEELAGEVVDIKPSQNFEARVELEEKLLEKSNYTLRKMTITISAEEELSTYMREMSYKGQKEKAVPIPIDTGKYCIKVDEREMIMQIVGRGRYWGAYCENSHMSFGREVIDAHILEIHMPDNMDFDKVHEVMKTLFPDAVQVENVEEIQSDGEDAGLKPSMG